MNFFLKFFIACFIKGACSSWMKKAACDGIILCRRKSQMMHELPISMGMRMEPEVERLG